MTAIAGTGASGNVDAAIGVRAEFGTMYGVRIDSNGFLFAADVTAGAMRAIDKNSGTVTTVETAVPAVLTSSPTPGAPRCWLAHHRCVRHRVRSVQGARPSPAVPA
jgi:hypothetical protein